MTRSSEAAAKDLTTDYADYTDAQRMTRLRTRLQRGRRNPNDEETLALSFLSRVSCAEKISLPTKHAKRRENFKGEGRLVRVPSTRLGVRSGGRSNPAAWRPPLLVRPREHPCNPYHSR